jgi:hypothetical protein
MFNPSTERKEAAVQNLIETAHAHQQQPDDTTTAQDRNLTEVFALLRGSLSQMEQMLKANFAHIDITQLTLNSLYYFVEHTDERKNPSWKRRVHRFHPGIDYQQVADLNDALFLCELSYLDSVEQIQEKLVDYKDAVEMIYCETESSGFALPWVGLLADDGSPALSSVIFKITPQEADLLNDDSF